MYIFCDISFFMTFLSYFVSSNVKTKERQASYGNVSFFTCALVKLNCLFCLALSLSLSLYFILYFIADFFKYDCISLYVFFFMILSDDMFFSFLLLLHALHRMNTFLYSFLIIIIITSTM